MAETAIQTQLQAMAGKPAWGLCRTIGSMFFLEIGESVSLPGEKAHGKWHFLIEWLAWEFVSSKVLVSSSDSQEQIDKGFDQLELGLVKGVSISQPSNILVIQFSSGVAFNSFSEPSEENAKQWILYCPDDIAWTSNTHGNLENTSIFS